MLAKNGHIRIPGLIAAAVLLAVFAVAKAESLAKGSPNSSQQSKSSQKRLTPYEILRRSKFQPAAEQVPANFTTGPVMDKATAEAPPAEAEPLKWRSRTIWGPSKSGRTPLYTQYQAILRDKI